MVRKAVLANLNLPEFGTPTIQPILNEKIYLKRLEKLRQKCRGMFSHVFVYGDREHSANIAYLTGYDPRFEEAALVVDIEGDEQWIMVGNEGMGYLEISPIKEHLQPVLYQPFSLLGQDRTRSSPLKDVLQDTGMTRNSNIGVVGWKYYSSLETENPDQWMEVPSYIVDTLRVVSGNVRNATEVFMHQTDGLRATNEVEQLAVYEYAATLASQAVRNVIYGIKPGMTEYDAVQLMKLNGYPHSVHLMLSTGERAWIGLPSPSNKKIQKGEAFTTAVGLMGALNCRAGWLMEDESQLPAKISDYIEKLAAPYFEAIVAWYELMGIGTLGGDLYKAVHKRIGDPFYGVELNPGHLIGLDEWVNSPIYKGSKDRIKPGMAIQVDVIPGTGTDYFTINTEDGICIADQATRNKFMEHYPEAWDRIIKRRDYMVDEIGIHIKPEVLPFSNLAAHLPPFILRPDRAFRIN
jgi:Xaa-Pro aminopeptidase